MIEVNNLRKSFQVHKKEAGLWGSVKALFKRSYLEKEAVKDATFRIEAGEIVGLVGANGAGKTTLVKMLSGVMFPSSGQATVLGFTPWQREYQFRRSIALIMGQKAQLWWDLPAEDCFLLLREIYQIPRSTYSNRLNELVEKLEVKDQLNIQIRRLSLGERMKMELIAALLHAPKVVFLDEPTIGLDLTAQRSIRKFLLDYRKEHKPAMILTSHYMEDIEQLSERIMIIRDGEFVYDGRTAEIVNKHAQHKIIKVKLADDIKQEKLPQLSKGEFISPDGADLRIKTAHSDISSTVSQILSQMNVVDISIEGEDIANIIESIMRVKH